MTNISYLIQGNQITLVIDNKPYQISPSHISYEKIKKALKNGKTEKLLGLVDPKEVIISYAEGNVSIEGDVLTWKGEVLNSSIAEKMINMYKEGFPFTPLVNFLDNLMENSSYRAINELYGFLENANLPITEDGCFLAYKRVNEDYTDCYSGTISNAVGDIVRMTRHKVDDDSARTCSSGLHFCSLDYLQHFGGARVIILKINPRDVVSIPADYHDTKGRCCAYTVVGEVEDLYNPEKTFTSTTVDDQYKNVTVNGIKQNSKGQWIDSAGRYIQKHLIPEHKDNK